MRRLFLFVAAGAMALGVSCNKSELQQPDDPNNSGSVGGVGAGDTPVQVTLNTVSMSGSLGTLTPVSKSDSKSMSVVYSLGEEDEEVATKAATELTEEDVDGKVLNLWALQFNSAGKCVAADYVSGSAISQTNDKVTAMVTLVADAGTGNTVYFVANTGDANLFKDYPGSSTNTKTTFEAATKAAATELKPTAASGILMRGVYTGAVSEAAISAANLKLERLMAKVKLTYSIGGELNGTKNFKVESVRLRSVANAIYYCGTPSGKTVWPETGNHVDYAAETLAADPNSGTFVWYIPQNLQTSVKTQDATTASAAGTYIEIVGQCGLHGGNQVYYYIPVGSDGVTGTPKYDVKMNNKYDINVVLKGDNGADTRVERKPWSYSNCVMVAPSGKAYLSMPNRYEEAKAATPAITLGWDNLAGTDYDVKQIWAEPGVTTTLSYEKATGRINVSVGSGVGNALIGLFPKGSTYTNNNCIWSWQVWVTNYRPDGTKKYNLGVNSKVAESNGEVHTYGSNYATKVLTVLANGGGAPYSTTNLRVMMDRNLGATAALYAHPAEGRASRYPTYGLFYQWGRPTPFPKAGDNDDIPDNTAPSVAGKGTNVSGFPVLVAGPKSVAEAIKTPQNFYFNSGSPYDWTTPQNNALWGDGAKKTVYDPCPDGWRVAPNGTWDDFGTAWGSPFGKLASWAAANQKVAGGLYSAGSVKAFYPAPGYRSSGSGALWNVGNYGCSWSSTVPAGSSYARYLDFSYGGIGPNGSDYRAYGFQLRCLQE